MQPSLPNQAEPLSLDTFLRGLWRENPVFVMLLGMCPVLAVSNSTMNAIAMGLATTFVLVASSLLISLIRGLIPKQVRIASYIVIIATFVTVVDYAIQAISLELYNALGAFIQLIVANCVILGRAEAYASKQRLHTTLVNSLGMGAGFTLALLSLGTVREVLGNGSLLGYPVMPEGLPALGHHDPAARGLLRARQLAVAVCVAAPAACARLAGAAATEATHAG
jgi:Na+-translocating ferredoxin:NAD+ oxidoreductase subunit E